MELRVLYEDNHIIGVYKPAGMLVQGDKTRDPTLMDQVKYYLKQTYQKPGNVFLGMAHRLDRPVSGIIVFGKTSKGAARLSEQFRNHTVKKVYHALVEGVPKEKSKALIHYVKKDAKQNVVKVYDRAEEGAVKAELSYEVQKSGKSASLLKIKLKTGRSHQIRAQLAHIGHPIVGDVKYGGPLSPFGIALCAASLTFKLATKDEWETVEIEIPKEWI